MIGIHECEGGRSVLAPHHIVPIIQKHSKRFVNTYIVVNYQDNRPKMILPFDQFRARNCCK